MVITEQDKFATLKSVDSMLEGSVASADTLNWLTANFASGTKISGNRKTVTLDKVDVENFAYPIPIDDKAPDEMTHAEA